MGTVRDYNHWTNDELTISFGVGEAQVSRGGELAGYPGHHITQCVLLGAEAATFTTPYVVDYGAKIPEDTRITGGSLDTETTWVGASGTLDIGLCLASAAPAAVTEGDYDGLWEALTIAELTTGLVGFPADGAYVGSTSGTDAGGYLVCAESNTTTMTAGASMANIYWTSATSTAAT
jgi:hypothetical protein